MSRKLEKFVVLFDNTNLLYFPGQFLSGRVLVELKDDTQALGKYNISYNMNITWQYEEKTSSSQSDYFL